MPYTLRKRHWTTLGSGSFRMHCGLSADQAPSPRSSLNAGRCRSLLLASSISARRFAARKGVCARAGLFFSVALRCRQHTNGTPPGICAVGVGRFPVTVPWLDLRGIPFLTHQLGRQIVNGQQDLPGGGIG